MSEKETIVICEICDDNYKLINPTNKEIIEHLLWHKLQRCRKPKQGELKDE